MRCPVAQGTCSTSCTASPPGASTHPPLTPWWTASCSGGPPAWLAGWPAGLLGAGWRDCFSANSKLASAPTLSPACSACPACSIQRAHASVQPGRLSVGAGELLGANINRSPTAYLENPQQEREMYGHDIDKEMTLLRVDDAEGRWARWWAGWWAGRGGL